MDLFNNSTLKPLHDVLPDSLHPTLVEMAETMFVYLVEDEEAVSILGLDRLAEIVIGQIDRLALKCGGAGFYLPKGIAAKLSARDQEIATRFNGANRRELAREYQVTEVRIDQIIAKYRRIEFERRQGRLPLEEVAK